MIGPDPNLPSRYGTVLGQGLEIKPGLISLDFQQAMFDEMATTLFTGGPLFMRTLNDLQLTSQGLEQCAGYELINPTALTNTIRNISDFDNSTVPSEYVPKPIVLSLTNNAGELNVYDWDGTQFQLRGVITPGTTAVTGDGSFVQYGLVSYLAVNTNGSLSIQSKVYGANYATAAGTPPTASAIMQLGNRLVALAAANDASKAQWTDNGNYDLWTGTSSGSAIVLPEGFFNDQNPMIVGSLVEQGALIFRRNTIVLMSVTGQSAAPFRFATIIPGLGIAGKQAVARTSLCRGLFFVTNGYSVMYYDNGQLQDLSYPIRYSIQQTGASSVTLAIDEANADLWLMVQSHTMTLFRLNLNEFLERKRILWNKVDTSSLTAIGGTDTVDTIGAVFSPANISQDILTEGGVELLTEAGVILVTDIPFVSTLKNLWIACSNFKIVGTKYSTIASTAVSETVDMRVSGEEVTIDRFRLIGYNYTGITPSPVNVAFSMDSGVTWSTTTTFTPNSNKGFQLFDGTLNLTGKFIRIRFGMPTAVSARTFAVQRMELLVNDRGRGTN